MYYWHTYVDKLRVVVLVLRSASVPKCRVLPVQVDTVEVVLAQVADHALHERAPEKKHNQMCQMFSKNFQWLKTALCWLFTNERLKKNQMCQMFSKKFQWLKTKQERLHTCSVVSGAKT